MPQLSWTEILTASFTTLGRSLVDFLPKLLGALVIVVVGVIISVSLGKLVAKFIRLLKVDMLVEKLEVEQALEHAGLKISVSGIIGWLVKWFLLLAFLITAADVLGWVQIVQFLNQVVLYLPNVIVSVLILLAGLMVGNFTSHVVRKGVEAARLTHANFLASVAKWSVLVFSLMAALVQLRVAGELIEILFTGLVFMMTLAGGLAFGLGGKERASKFLEGLRKEMH
jgi:hypothetical protein